MWTRCRHRFQQLPGGVGAAPVHPDQEIHAGQLRGSHRYQQGIRGQSTAALLHRADRTVQGLRDTQHPIRLCYRSDPRMTSQPGIRSTDPDPTTEPTAAPRTPRRRKLR